MSIFLGFFCKYVLKPNMLNSVLKYNLKSHIVVRTVNMRFINKYLYCFSGVRTVLVLDEEARPAALQSCQPRGDSR